MSDQQTNTTLAPPTKKLTARQKLFAIEYMRDGDAKRAAMATGTPEPGANNIGHEYLNNPRFAHVRAEVDRLMKEKQEDTKVDAKKVVNELAKVAFFNPKQLLDDEGNLKSLQDIPDHVAVCIKKFRVSQRMGADREGNPTRIRATEIEFWSKMDALKQLGQHLGLIKDVTNNVNVLAIDWAALMGRKPVTNDPIETRLQEAEAKALLAAAQREQEPLNLPGDPLNTTDSTEGGDVPGLPCALRELEDK